MNTKDAATAARVEPIVSRCVHLLTDGESLLPFEDTGWIQLGNQIRPGDEVVIDWPEWSGPRLFDRPVRAVVENASGQRLSISLLTAANDCDGTPWSVGKVLGWMPDGMWRYTYSINKG